MKIAIFTTDDTYEGKNKNSSIKFANSKIL